MHDTGAGGGRLTFDSFLSQVEHTMLYHMLTLPSWATSERSNSASRPVKLHGTVGDGAQDFWSTLRESLRAITGLEVLKY